MLLSRLTETFSWHYPLASLVTRMRAEPTLSRLLGFDFHIHSHSAGILRNAEALDALRTASLVYSTESWALLSHQGRLVFARTDGERLVLVDADVFLASVKEPANA